MNTYTGRHRAEDITLDLTIENLARYHAYSANIMRTYYTGHLGVPGRHEKPTRYCGRGPCAMLDGHDGKCSM